MLLALWGAKSGIAKMGFWASLVIPRSQKTKVKKNFDRGALKGFGHPEANVHSGWSLCAHLLSATLRAT